jgi:hypothetical protein
MKLYLVEAGANQIAVVNASLDGGAVSDEIAELYEARDTEKTFTVQFDGPRGMKTYRAVSVRTTPLETRPDV